MQAPAGPSEAAPSSGRAQISSLLQGAFVVGYPLAVYLAYTRLETRALALGLLALYTVALVLRFHGSASEIWGIARQHIGLPVLIGVALATGSGVVLLFLPVAVNLYLLWTFSSTLRDGPPMIERFARLVEDDLPDFTLPYCRKVTIVWCAFLAMNALAIVLLSLAAPVAWWALYTGLISYVLMGALFAGEFVLRKVWFRHYGDGLADGVSRQVFPPERTANGRRSLAYAAQRAARTAG